MSGYRNRTRGTRRAAGPQTGPAPALPNDQPPAKPEVQAIIDKMSDEELQRKLKSKHQHERDAAAQKIQDALDKADVISKDGKFYWPRSILDDCDRMVALCRDESLDMHLYTTFFRSMAIALGRIYSPAIRGTGLYVQRAYESLEVCVALLSVLMLRIAPWALEGTAPKVPWLELYTTYSQTLQNLQAYQDQNVDEYARGMLACLGFKAMNEPDLSEGRPFAFTLLHRLECYNTPGLGLYMKKLTPDPQTVGIALLERLWDSRTVSVPDIKETVPSSFHQTPYPQVQDSAGHYDPTLPIVNWLSNDTQAYEMIRMAMDPSPPTLSKMLALNRREFVERMHDSLGSLPDFPELHIIADPFYLTPILLNGWRYELAEPEQYPKEVYSGGTFYVYGYQGEDSQYTNMLSYDLKEWVSFILFELVRMKLPFALIELGDHREPEVQQETWGDVDDVTFAEAWRPGDPFGIIIHSALSRASARAAATKFTGIPREAINRLVNESEARVAARFPVSAVSRVKAFTPEEAESLLGNVLKQGSQGAATPVENGLSEFIGGLAGWEWLDGGVLAAMDSFMMDADWEIKQLYGKYGQPETLVDGEKMDTSQSALYERLPVVRTGQGFTVSEDPNKSAKTHTGKMDAEQSEIVEDDDGNYSFNPGGF